MNIPDASPEIAALLYRLLAEANTGITQHYRDPRPDVWYVGRGDTGERGPYASAEDALITVVAWLWQRLDEVSQERDTAQAEAAQMRAELEQIRAQMGQVAAELLRLSGSEQRW